MQEPLGLGVTIVVGVTTPDGLVLAADSRTTASGDHADHSSREVMPRLAAELKFEQFLEFAPDAIVGIDREGMIGFFNRQLEALFGYTGAELVGEPVEALMPERFRAAHGGHRRKYFQDPRARDGPRPRPLRTAQGRLGVPGRDLARLDRDRGRKAGLRGRTCGFPRAQSARCIPAEPPTDRLGATVVTGEPAVACGRAGRGRL